MHSSTNGLALAANESRPWEGSHFSANPAVFYQAASAIPTPAGEDAVVIWEEQAHVFETDGRPTRTYYIVFKVVTQKGAESWADISWNWEPWHEERPILKARVITPDREEHVLNPKAIGDAAARRLCPSLPFWPNLEAATRNVSQLYCGEFAPCLKQCAYRYWLLFWMLPQPSAKATARRDDLVSNPRKKLSSPRYSHPTTSPPERPFFNSHRRLHQLPTTRLSVKWRFCNSDRGSSLRFTRSKCVFDTGWAASQT
jgi:hypothetical protein